MNKDNKKGKFPLPSFNGFWGTLLMTFLITVAFGLLIYGMYLTDIISLIDISSIFESKNAGKNSIDSNDRIYEALKTEDDTETYKFLYDITPEELTTILSGYKLNDNYSFRAETVNYGTGKNREISLRVTKSKDSFKVTKSEKGNVFETVSLENGVVTVTDNIRNRFSKYNGYPDFSFESVCGMPSLSQITDICSKIIDGDTESVTDYEISLVSDSSKTLYHVVFTYPDLSQKEEYYISSESGMIESAYTYFSDRLFYRYSLTDYSPAS